MFQSIQSGSVPVVLALVLAIGSAAAQNAPPKPNGQPAAAAPAAPVVPQEPSVTTASFGDWTLRCQRAAEPATGPARICEVAQVMQVQGQQAPIAQIALGRLAAGEPLRLTAVMPLSVSFPSSVQIVLGDKDPKPVEANWRRCMPTGCVAELVPSEDMLKQWRKGTEPGRILFRDAAGRELALPFSARGLDPALDALAKEKL